MCLTRIYCRRKRDGAIIRFNSKALMVMYSRANHETRHTLPMITREAFIIEKNRLRDPQWLRSTRFEGMALLREGDGCHSS